MSLPTFSTFERAIRSAWAGDLPTARTLVDDETLLEGLELLANAPFAYKNAQADHVRGMWIRSGGIVPTVPSPGIATPLDSPSAWPHR